MTEGSPDLGRRHTHDLHLRLSDQQHQAVRSFASSTELGLNAAVRLLVERGLASDSPNNGAERESDATGERGLRTLQAAVFATLIASEQALSAIDSFLPSRNVGALAEKAADAARRRLEQVELSLAEAESAWQC